MEIKMESAQVVEQAKILKKAIRKTEAKNSETKLEAMQKEIEAFEEPIRTIFEREITRIKTLINNLE